MHPQPVYNDELICVKIESVTRKKQIGSDINDTNTHHIALSFLKKKELGFPTCGYTVGKRRNNVKYG